MTTPALPAGGGVGLRALQRMGWSLPGGGLGPQGGAPLQRIATQRTAVRKALALAQLRLRLAADPRPWLASVPAQVISAFDRIGRVLELVSWRTAASLVAAIRWRNVVLAASAPFLLPEELRAALVRIFAYLGAIFTLSLLAAEFFTEPVQRALPEPRPRPIWLEIDKPWPAFQFSSPGIADDLHYAIQRHSDGGGRKDILSLGELGRTRRFMSVEIYRPGWERASFEPEMAAMRELAAEQGRVTGLRQSLPIPSKFGPFAAFEFAIGPFSGYHCVGFVRAFAQPRVQIGGLACNMNLLVDRAAISCALDRLELLSAGSDASIARLFAQAELKRGLCGQREPLMHATPKRPAGEVTLLSAAKLRGRFAR